MISKNFKTSAFTIIELLVVISIIAILIGILVPSIAKIRILAKDLQQKSQFRAISGGIETYSNENENSYPSSDEDPNYYVYGAHKLTAALVGRDLFGHTPDGNMIPGEAYSTSLQERKEYIDKDKFLVVNPQQIYDTSVNLAGDDSTLDVRDYFPVISDLYYQKKITVQKFDFLTRQWTEKIIQVGSPILYFSANKTEEFIDNTALIGNSTLPAINYTNCKSWIYDWYDNEGFFNLPTIKSFSHTEVYHTYDDTHNGVDIGKAAFYKNIINYNVSTYLTPRNRDSYILMSAGADGIYGTKDDITNF
jgi:prepilin-type N-terminal cleavage/methylation domain-containing protein